jgi:glycosyltransferase involved in cell wall biosynthesis
VRKRRVLFITGEYPPIAGGIGDSVERLRAALVDLGWDSVVLTDPDGQGDDVEIVRRWDWSIAGRVAGLAGARDVDLIHIQYQAGAYRMHPAINVLPRSLRGRVNQPVLTTFHDLRPPYLFPKAGPIRKALMLRMARWSAAAVVTNPADARTLAPAGIRLRHIPIGPNLPPPERASCEVDLGAIAFFGFPNRVKGIEDLIVAVGLIDSRRRPRLLLVGAQGTPSPNNDILRASVVDRLAAGADVRVERTSYLPPREASNTLARAGGIVLPFQRGVSLRSGSLLAALQSGRPVIATAPPRESDLGELARLPQLILVPRGDAGRLWDAIESALTEPREAQPLPDAYNWPAIATQHDPLYRAMLGE